MSAERKEQANVASIYRAGDEVTFGYTGKLRAIVDGYEIQNGKLVLRVIGHIAFYIPARDVVYVERVPKETRP